MCLVGGKTLLNQSINLTRN